ncbi:hypothetical protein [Chenggangzhangella methanolivorans]|uniref:Uncharacterized protein n=1 Tax=Chenggangzhangella methanolivorans TaxID=1437009 RepID=A0A9E6RAV9_9HYPH|nr:hypothetical protein [Chenggangzhangella methanolivorans]QZO00985.1 hypothetical protein K6K41_05070 [Chenggangzhangella methanolivorans]
MSYYRLYFLSPDNRISRFVELFHDSDQQALDDARGHVGGEAMELWNQERFVARIPAEEMTAKSGAPA